MDQSRTGEVDVDKVDDQLESGEVAGGEMRSPGGCQVGNENRRGRRRRGRRSTRGRR